MMDIISLLIGLQFGAVIGVLVMAIVQAGRDE